MARDIIHNIVKNALINDGWNITHDPYPVKVGGFEMEIDLGAENLVAAEREGEKIAIEVKTFAGLSKVYDFHLAVGQFTDYRIALKVREPERILYVGVTDNVYNEILELPFPQMVIKEINMKIIVVNPDLNTVIKWIK